MRNPPNDTDLNPSGPGKAPRQASHQPERKCILGSGHGPREALVRLALGPDGEVAPDVRARAPGRGAWIGVDRAALESAIAKGKLKGALSRAFKTGEIRIPEDLGERIETALRQAMVDRLGLEARASNLITGSARIEAAARKGQVVMLLHASDGSEEGRRRLDQAWRVGSEEEGSGRQGLVFPGSRTILSLALGRENVVHVAIVDSAAASRVRHAIDRWRAFIGRETELGAASAVALGEREVDVGEGIE